ncbi:3'(2'),5'-bisphosphate nucleotidase [Alteribacillus persepolensis]|uniref:3'(2'),5'-bisphosphate nucleotidase CysQ n=1 Tax=Alteribacillus persepolensis TaxID=568899 RepID=A0A1G8B1Z9_9BACI|nr:3'(2'),5'-bisphosphate nucleotidase CysQ [Alteribacillus persepolensis]SDH27196.1 3'(2'),5'-bisphosphate nucleotidase [Alteribacillus persepolensis]
MLPAIKAAVKAGEKIMEIYKTDFDVAYKDDASPLTVADQTAHRIITDILSAEWPDVPILSEEGEQLSLEERESWKQFWLVDPLDGTKEFIKKNDEFTVNIALIDNQKPIFGVVYAPALDVLYVGDMQQGAVRLDKAASRLAGMNRIEDCFTGGKSLPYIKEAADRVRVVASRSHMSDETEQFVQELKHTYQRVEVVSAGSSLKLCLIAAGEADFYPRYAPTMEWDTGAGQAVVEAAGGSVTVASDNAPLVYNKEHLQNPWFLASRKKG